MARRPASDKEREEMKGIVERCLAILTFYESELSRDAPNMINGYQQILQAALDQEDLRGLRLAARDFDEMATSGTPDQIQEVDMLLKERFGVGLKDAEAARAREVRRILKRGVIRNADEYRMVERRADELSQTDENSPEIVPINDLMVTYKGGLPE